MLLLRSSHQASDTHKCSAHGLCQAEYRELLEILNFRYMLLRPE